MEREPADLPEELTAYGALPSQLVDVSRETEPRVLSYLDLRTGGPGWRQPVVVENAGRPCVHVFDGRLGVGPEDVGQWCRRIALRGDGAWVGVVEPGRLRVYETEVEKNRVLPREVEKAKPGQWALPKFLNDASAGQDDVARRRYLIKLLETSAREATEHGLSARDALSLVGRGLFWRFLVDRGLLVGLTPATVCPTAESWAQCLDTKARALRTFQWLDQTFNGGLLPFEENLRTFDAAVFPSVLAKIAYGATETGQMRLPTDWQEVNFSYVPIGLLSEVYEAFAYNLDANKAASQSVHYTPSHLVDFIVSQALEQLPAGGNPRILDPAAGAGVFLVTVLRKLVEREWQETGNRPGRRRIRDILNKQIVGFDIDPSALRLAELALYLTALELDPKPRPLDELTFDELRGSVLFDLSRTTHGSLGPVKAAFRNRFDLVIGNPPWTAKQKGLEEKRAWVTYTRDVVVERLGWSRVGQFDFPDTNTDLPFVWRAMQWAKSGGRIALAMHARWLFGISSRYSESRNDLLQAVRVTGILNGSALRLTNVWPEVDAPWCILFATNERPGPAERAAFQFVSPALDLDTDSKQWRMRIDWVDAQPVLASEVIERPWSLKARFRGNRLASRALDSMRREGEALGAYLKRLGTTFWNGYQVSDVEGTGPSAAHLKGLPDTKDAGPLSFFVNAAALPRFERKTIYRRKERSIFTAPLLLLRKAIPADLTSPRAHLAKEDVAFHESLHGASFVAVPGGDKIAAYLQLVLQSSVFPFFEVLTDAQYGVFVDAIYKESALALPIVPFDRLARAQRKRAARLSNRLAAGWTKKLAADIDAFVFDTFNLSDVEREAIRDTLHTALPSTESKRKAVSAPDKGERTRFIATLQDSLQSVLSASGLLAEVHERSDLDWSPWSVLEVRVDREDVSRSTEAPVGEFLKAADESGASLVVVRANPTSWIIGLLQRYALWTPTRARLLATDLIAERSAS